MQRSRRLCFVSMPNVFGARSLMLFVQPKQKASMKTLVTLITLLLLALPGFAAEQMKPLGKDIPLSEGIRQANELFPDAQPLTEEEVIAAVKAIKLKHPDIKPDVYDTYMRVVKERVLPKGMYFSRIT